RYGPTRPFEERRLWLGDRHPAYESDFPRRHPDPLKINTSWDASFDSLPDPPDPREFKDLFVGKLLRTCATLCVYITHVCGQTHASLSG
ncbi:hypothetical protein MTO96_040063, partial [Rhipicephalus appendiculatus]